MIPRVSRAFRLLVLVAGLGGKHRPKRSLAQRIIETCLGRLLECRHLLYPKRFRRNLRPGIVRILAPPVASSAARPDQLTLICGVGSLASKSAVAMTWSCPEAPHISASSRIGEAQPGHTEYATVVGQNSIVTTIVSGCQCLPSTRILWLDGRTELQRKSGV